MISIKSDREIELLRVAGSIVYDTHCYLKKFIKPFCQYSKHQFLIA